MAFKKLGSILPKRLRQTGIHSGVQAARVIDVANNVLCELFGNEITKNQARAVSCRHKQLRIATMNASLRQELMVRQKDIIQRINKTLGQEYVERVVVVI